MKTRQEAWDPRDVECLERFAGVLNAGVEAVCGLAE